MVEFAAMQLGRLIPPPRSNRWGALFLVLLAFLAAGCGRGDGVMAEATERPKPRPLVVVALDGATWDLIDPMMARGELPIFRQLVRRGLRADLIAIPPLTSPVVWTTISTGRFARHHNLLDHAYPYVQGPKRRVDSTLRRVPALWNIASHYSRTVGVFGYYATHPPEAVNGVMVSDRAARGVGGAIYPAEMVEELQPELDRLSDPEVIREISQTYLPWPFDPKAIHRSKDPYHAVTKVVQGTISPHYRFEDFIQRASLRLTPRRFDLSMIYLRMIDHASHATWLYFDDSEFDEKPSAFDKDLLKDVIPAAYRQTDDFLGRLLEAVGSEANVVVLSDHGFGPAVDLWRIRRKEIQSVNGNHRPNGILLAAGPDIRQGEVEDVTILDIAPTLLTLLGLPVSEELPGEVQKEIFRPEFLAEYPIDETPSFRMRWEVVDEEATPSVEAETEDMKTLAALGYLGEGIPLARKEDDQDVGFWSVDIRLRRDELLGEILFHLLRADIPAIDQIVAEIEEKDPDLKDDLLIRAHMWANLWQLSFGFQLFSEPTQKQFDAAYPFPKEKKWTKTPIRTRPVLSD